jgi:hypothetical protein
MATVTVDATYQGFSSYFDFGVTDWVNDIRDVAIGNFTQTYTTNTQDNNAIRVTFISGRLGTSGDCYRTFLFFDTGAAISSAGGGTITAATLKVYNGGSAETIKTVVVAAYAWGGDGSDGNLNDGDYDSIDYNAQYNTLISSSWNGSAYNDFALNANAIADMNTNGYLNCAVIEYDYDYSGVNPPSNTISFAPVEFLDSTNPIKLDITYTPAGYPNKVIGVASASVGKVISISSANISKVIGVS